MSAVQVPPTSSSHGTLIEGPHSDLVRSVVSMRDSYLGHGMRAGPSDRYSAESAVAQLYRYADLPVPRFAWELSPAAAAARIARDKLASAVTFAVEGPTCASARIATLLSISRSRMDARIRVPVSERPPPRWPMTIQSRALRAAQGRIAAAVRNQPPETSVREGIGLNPIIRSTVWDSLHTSLFDGVAAAIKTLMPALVGGIPWYGQQEAHRIAYYDIYRSLGLATFQPQDNELLDSLVDLTESTGWWWAFDDVCVMSDRPTQLYSEPIPDRVHGERRLHHHDEPAIQFADGSAVYVLNGTIVPDWVVLDPSVERITVERNVEIRRSAIERIGWDNYIDAAGLALVDNADDLGNDGCTLQLFATPAGWGGEGRVLLAVNGSRERDGQRRRYGLYVPGEFSSALDAAGWTYGLSGENYAQLLRRT